VSETLVKQLKLARQIKINIKNNIFSSLKNNIHNFQENISFDNTLTSVS